MLTISLSVLILKEIQFSVNKNRNKNVNKNVNNYQNDPDCGEQQKIKRLFGVSAPANSKFPLR